MLVGLFCGVPDWLGVAALLEPTSLPGQLRRKKQAGSGRFAAWKPGVLKSKSVICCKDFWTSPDLTPNVFGQCFWYVFVESLIGLEMRSSQNSEMQILISSKWPIDDILLTSLDKSDFKMGGSKFWDHQAMIWQSL